MVKKVNDQNRIHSIHPSYCFLPVAVTLKYSHPITPIKIPLSSPHVPVFSSSNPNPIVSLVTFLIF